MYEKNAYQALCARISALRISLSNLYDDMERFAAAAWDELAALETAAEAAEKEQDI